MLKSACYVCTAHAAEVREDIERGVYVEGLAEETVESADQAVEAMLRGATNRRVGSTAMNRESSRSHRSVTWNVCCGTQWCVADSCSTSPSAACSR